MVQPVDVWVRQILGNTGEVGFKEAMKATKSAEKNITNGLYPTTGGAISLMDKGMVDILYQSNTGRAGFAPRLPDRDGKPATSREEWYVAAIEQAVLHRSSGLFSKKDAFNPAKALAMNGLLHTWHVIGVDWKRIYDFAKRLDSTVPPYGGPPFWMRSMYEPMSVLAFCGERLRARAPNV